MFKEFVKNIYFKVYFSAYYSKLNNVRDLLNNNSTNDFKTSIESFYLDILRFPFVYFYKSKNVQNEKELLSRLSLLPEGEIKQIYQQNTELFLKIENEIKDHGVKDGNQLLFSIESFLDSVFESFGNLNKRIGNYIQYSFIAILIVAFFFIAPPLYSYFQ